MDKRKPIKTQFRGVYYRESDTRRYLGKPDRCYLVWYKDAAGKARWYTVGWHSDGVRAAVARDKRAELIRQVKTGGEPARDERLTVGDAMRAYMTWAEAEGKILAPERNRWERHLAPRFAAVPLQAVSVPMLTDVKRDLLATMSPATAKHCFALLRRAVNYLLDTGQWSGSNPFAQRRHSGFAMPRVDNKAERYLTPDEARALLAELKERSRQLHNMALLALRTGMRATEIFSIRGGDIDPAGMVIHFRQKGGMRDLVHAPKDVIAMLQSYRRAPAEYIFQSKTGEAITAGISETFNRAVDALGLNDGVDDNRHRVRFHTLRHTFASWLAQSGEVTLQELKELMRHKRIEMTERYAHLIPGHQKGYLGLITNILHSPSSES